MGRPGLPSKTFCFLPNIIFFYVCSEQNCKSRWNIILMFPTSYIWSPPQPLNLDSWLPGPRQYNPAALPPPHSFSFPNRIYRGLFCFLAKVVAKVVNMITTGSMDYFSSGHKMHFNRHFAQCVWVHGKKQMSLVGSSLKSHAIVLFLSVEFAL